MTDEVHLETSALLATNVVLPMGMTLDEVEIQTGAVGAIIKPFSLKLANPAALTVRISGANIAAFLEKESPGGLKGFVVGLVDGFVNVEAIARVIVEIRVLAVCTLRVVDGCQIFVDLDSLSVKAPMAHSMVEQQLAKVNPILDLKNIAENISIDSVEVGDGFVTVRGKANYTHSG